MTPHGDIGLDQHWLGWWFVAWWHQAITWTSVDFSLVRFFGIHLRAIPQWALKLLFCIMSLKILLLKFLLHLPGANELHNISRIRPRAILGPVKSKKFLHCLHFQRFKIIYFLTMGHDPYGFLSTRIGFHHWCFCSWEILRYVPRMQISNNWWVPFEFWWVYDAGRGNFGISAFLIVSWINPDGPTSSFPWDSARKT